MPATIRIDGSESYECEIGDTVLRAALRAGLPFPYECNVGQCGSCRFELLDGEIEDLWPGAPALNERDRRKGRKLGCQSMPLGNCTIKLRPDPNCVPRHHPTRQVVELIGVEDVTHDIREFRFRGDGPAIFQPGQYALLEIAGVTGLRAYSMCNNANEDGEWHFLIKRVSEGAGTSVLFDDFETGCKVSIDAPYGLAYLRDAVARDIVCIAGGSGLSPLISIARAASVSPVLAERRLRFFFGGRGPADICGEDYLRSLPGYAERMTYQAAISVPELDARHAWVGYVGFVHELVFDALGANLGDYEYYLAGPPPMLQATLQMLVMDHKVPLEQVHYDRFF